MADFNVRRGGTGADRTQFGAHLREEGASLGGAEAATPETLVPEARIDYDKARNAKTTTADLDTLAESKSDVVRLEVAQNPNTSAKALRNLAGAGDPLLRDVARLNPAYEPETAGERASLAVERLRRGPQPSRLIDA